MKTKNILLLGSKSPSRKMLLDQVQIPYRVVEQHAQESDCDWGMPLQKLVESIALHKMNHVILPKAEDGQVCFVLTADTLSQDMNGTIHGKPTSREDAIEKIKSARNGSRLCTAFCLDRRVWRAGEWHIDKRMQQSVFAEYLFVIPDEWIDTYLDTSIGLECSNAIAIEGYGSQFLKTISGSYTTIVGLPLYEVRQALEQLGFFHE